MMRVVSGQVPVDDSGALIGKGDIEAQTRKVFGNIQALCEAAGGSLDNIVFLNIYLTDMRFRRAVHPGDTLTAHITVADGRPTSDPERGLVLLSYEIMNQDDVKVLEMKGTYLFRRKPGASDV